MKDGKSFEAQVADFYRVTVSNNPGSVVSQNERIAGPDGDREFDVVIRTQVADIDLITIIECKDYSRLINLTTVDAFASKLEDIHASKGILVSRKGFTKNALEKAKRLNISACTLDHAAKLAKDSELNIPVLFRRIEFGKLSASLEAAKPGFGGSLHFDANSFICDTGIMDIVKLVDPGEIIRKQHIEVDLSEVWNGRDIWCRNLDGEKISLSSCKFRFELVSPVHFGFLSDLPSSMYKSDEISKDASLIFDIADFKAIEKTLRAYHAFSEVPNYAKKFFLEAVVCAERVESVGKVSLYARLCCTNPVRDSFCESSVVAGGHEQTDTPRLQDQELAGL